MEHSGIVMKDEEGMIIKDVNYSIIWKVHGQKTKEYIIKINKWTNSIFESVDWKGLNAYLQTLTMQKWINIIKLVHNWQNTGSQK